MRNPRRPLCTAALFFALPMAYAQQSIVDGKTNLIVNGDAEMGPASPDGKTIVSSIPGWTRGAKTASGNVLSYGLTGKVLLSDPAPPDHGFNYFTGNSSNSTLTQIIDVSSSASIISGGNVKYTASAYLGSSSDGGHGSQVVMAFQNAGGQTFSTATLGPLTYPGSGLTLQQQTGLVPTGTMQITVTLTLTTGVFSAADSLSLVLGTLGTMPGSVLGTNLVVNGGAESGPNAPVSSVALNIPGWSTADEVSVAPYGGTNWITASDPGPADRGVNVFCAFSPANIYQDIDVSPASSLIDSGQVMYQISAWLGGLSGSVSPTLKYTFFDWSGAQLAATGQLGPAKHSGTGLVETSDSGALPSGTRRVRIALTLSNTYLADNVAFTLTAPSAPPVISSGGVISASGFGGFSSIAPGTFVEIYGYNLASSTRGWSGSDFTGGVAPTSLDGVIVSVGGEQAFVNYISPGQVNILVPSDVPTGSGTVDVTVTNANGTSEPFGVYVNQTEPGLLVPSSFNLSGKQYVAATLPDGTFALPEGAISGVASRPAMPGETVTIYGIGFGDVDPSFPAGTLVTQQNTLVAALKLLFGTTAATLEYAGLAPSFTGLYQFNVVVPNVGANNAEALSVEIGGAKSGQTLYIAVGK